MANIYLRISKYVASFLRGDGQGGSIHFSHPIEFSPYTQEYAIIANSLRVIPAAQQHRASCYSQSAWNNMLRGRKPEGGPPLIVRKQTDPLSYAELCVLEGIKNKQKLDGSDFLCIALPRETYFPGKVTRTNATMTLDTEACRDLRRLLRRTFTRTFLEFKQKNVAFAHEKGISRSNIEIIERFLMMYDMPVSHDLKERESLRRLIIRWEKEASYYANSEAVAGDEIIGRIDEHELRGRLPRYTDED